MDTRYNDIITPRLTLRLMGDEVITACLSGHLAEASQLLDADIPAELLDKPSSLHYNQQQVKTDPAYGPWAARAIIHRNKNIMIGIIRFHSSPDPAYLRPYTRDAVELGYRIFSDHRRQGYAAEAVAAVMDWAVATSGIRRFVASVSPVNIPSSQLLARFGFIKVGETMDDTDGMEHIFLRMAGE